MSEPMRTTEADYLPPESVTGELLARVGLTRAEYERARELMRRELTIVELGIFGAMWSEHCCYKSSKIHLKKLPVEAPHILQGPGENAGIVDIGGGVAVAFKIESHNHPSAVEPFQGAATGVGGIIRDVFAMGARPIALLDPLRFGPIAPMSEHEETEVEDAEEEERTRARTRYLLGGVVAGIAHYGNCIGIPTVGGEIHFDESYSTNPLVNVLCLGTVDPKEIVRGIAKGQGNPVFYVGAKTGRDGIQGATFASVNLAEDASQDRPAVQVGDPFYEKLLLEACLEVAKIEGLIGMQDMGAAGLTSSSCEMAARGGAGIELDLDKIPKRSDDLTAYEMMLSESQERMLIAVVRGKEKSVVDAFGKWELDAVEVGKVISEKVLRVKKDGKVVAEIPNEFITIEAPEYNRPAKTPEYFEKMPPLDPDEVARVGIHIINEHPWDNRLPAPPMNQPYADLLFRLLAHPNVASKRVVMEQYDHTVRTNTIPPYDGDAAVVRIKGTERAVAISTDCPSHVCYLDPYAGVMRAVCEAAQNLVAVGARPLAITNCLNFGNPEDPEVMWQFIRTIEGMIDSLTALDTPVTGGNVSFYNETKKYAVNPTPVIGMVGALENTQKRIPQTFQSPGNLLFVAGGGAVELDGSSLAYYALGHGSNYGKPSAPDMQRFKTDMEFVLAAMDAGLVRSCHDAGDGGLAVCAAEMAFGSAAGGYSQMDGSGGEVEASKGRYGQIGCDITISGYIKHEHSDSGAELKAEHLLAAFGEGAGRWLVEVAPKDADRFAELAAAMDARIESAGRVTRDGETGESGVARLTFAVDNLKLYGVRLADAEAVWSRSFELLLA